MKMFQSCLFACLLLMIAVPSYGQAVKETNYGFSYADGATIKTFISPIKKEWGRLVSVTSLGTNQDRYVFEAETEIVIAVITIRENIIAGHGSLQVDNLWHIKKTKEK
ncbi:MAG: hypothetical protein ACI9BD_000982 [Candidatus Marinamargulisbacteria bacterium]|jgi:hypothetical protein